MMTVGKGLSLRDHLIIVYQLLQAVMGQTQ